MALPAERTGRLIVEVGDDGWGQGVGFQTFYRRAGDDHWRLYDDQDYLVTGRSILFEPFGTMGVKTPFGSDEDVEIKIRPLVQYDFGVVEGIFRFTLTTTRDYPDR